jgi:hypothetical protein
MPVEVIQILSSPYLGPYQGPYGDAICNPDSEGHWHHILNLSSIWSSEHVYQTRYFQHPKVCMQMNFHSQFTVSMGTLRQCEASALVITVITQVVMLLNRDR